MKARWGLLLLLSPLAVAHVGVKDVYFEGLAGPYPLNVVIRPPSVIPGVAEIQIRAGANDVRSIHITPMTLTGQGSKYPPTPDLAQVDASDPQTFRGSCWLMVTGSWQVRLLVEGERGRGVLSVPVAAASDRVAEMGFGMGAILAGLVGLLVLGAVGIAGAAIGEGGQAPGEGARPGAGVWGGGAGGLALAAGAIFVGWNWWDREAASYSQSLYKPLQAKVQQEGSRLYLELVHTGWYQSPKFDDLIDDHGHRMHLFLVKDPGAGALYHLHPQEHTGGKFRFALPKIDGGRYRVFADVVHRTGFPETVTAAVDLTAVEGTYAGDDAGLEIGKAGGLGQPYRLENGWEVRYVGEGPLLAQKPTKLSFEVVDADGNRVKNLQYYLGMPGHLAIVKKDFQVFAHLHPAGTTAQSALELAERSLDAVSPGGTSTGHGAEMGASGEIGFPFGFPRPGEYRIILQFRDSRAIFSAPFDFSVQ